jgi:hypothetical protein
VLLYALAFVCLKKNRDALAGGWLALGLFKPHLVLPFIFILLIQGRKKVLYGFLLIAAMLALSSAAIVGTEGMLLYPRYVVHLEGTLAQGAIVPAEMPNLRGALNLLFPGAPHIVPAILVVSLSLLVFTAWVCRKTGSSNLFDLTFSLATLATVLVSYHAMVYDLSMLMLPVLLLVNDLLAKDKFRGWRSALVLTAAATLFFPPLLLVLSMRDHRSALLGWVLLLWLYGAAREISFRASEKIGLQSAGTAG